MGEIVVWSCLGLLSVLRAFSDAIAKGTQSRYLVVVVVAVVVAVFVAVFVVVFVFIFVVVFVAVFVVVVVVVAIAVFVVVVYSYKARSDKT